VVNGVARCSITVGVAGAHAIRAIYSGSGSYGNGVAGPITQTVNASSGSTPGASITPPTELSRITTDVGYEPKHTLETGISAYIDWLRTNPCPDIGPPAAAKVSGAAGPPAATQQRGRFTSPSSAR